MNNELLEAKYLIDAMTHSSNELRYKEIAKLASDILAPYVSSQEPNALWLKTRLPDMGLKSITDDESFDEEFDYLIQLSAEGGCREAEYIHACNLSEEQKHEEAMEFYERSAGKGYAPSLWCLGVNHIYGLGEKKVRKSNFLY